MPVIGTQASYSWKIEICGKAAAPLWRTCVTQEPTGLRALSHPTARARVTPASHSTPAARGAKFPSTPRTHCDRRGAIKPSVHQLLLAAALAAILAATLTPAGTDLQPEFSRCLVCGSRGVSDAIVNVILFAPLGAALAFGGRTGWRSVLLGGLLSCGVEVAQIFIPGRDPSLGDVTFNTLGTAAGQGLFWLAGRCLLPGSRTAARLSLLAGAAALAVFAATARLLEPWLPARSLDAWYTADLPEMEWYDGRVLATTLGPVAFRPSRPPHQDVVQRLLLAGAPLRIDAIAGHAVPALAPLLVILNEHGHEMFLVGPDRDDLVLRYRSRGARWRLDRPDLRLRGAFASLSPGDTLQITVRREGRGYCLALNDVARCGLGYSVGSGWALLYYPHHFPAWALLLIETGWVAGIVFPVGLWARRRLETALAITLLGAGLFVLPSFTGLIPTPLHQIVGTGAGLLLGLALQVRRRSVSAPDA